jgi:formate-dependent phosphoribosylglycinamide formyltransferase (GAR transformylase)
MLGMKKFHLRWVPYALNTNQKVEIVILSNKILSGLQSVRFTGVEHVVTGDELWFFLYHPHDPI